MTYCEDHPVRLVGGRLAIDFLNTADWRVDGTVAHEWIDTRADLDIWLRAVGLSDASRPASIDQLHTFRDELRRMFTGTPGVTTSNLQESLKQLRIAPRNLVSNLRRQPMLGLIAVSALSILSDPRELNRLKMCPGKDCGWMFVDETKNARRKWCAMDLCGNRAKALRSYERKVRALRASA